MNSVNRICLHRICARTYGLFPMELFITPIAVQLLWVDEFPLWNNKRCLKDKQLTHISCKFMHHIIFINSHCCGNIKSFNFLFTTSCKFVYDIRFTTVYLPEDRKMSNLFKFVFTSKSTETQRTSPKNESNVTIKAKNPIHN